MNLLHRVVISAVIVTITNIGLPAQSQNKCMFDRTRPITIEGGKYRPIRFGNTKTDFHLKGNFNAHGAKIGVFIVDVENFAKMINFEKFEYFYGVKKATKGEFDVSLEMGNYHLVWWNESTDKTVVIEADVCFSHPEQ